MFGWLRKLIQIETKAKTVDDIDLNKVDFAKHKLTFHSGTVLYRIVHAGTDPLQPTGRYSRFVTEPMGFEPSKVLLRVPGYAHTGAACYSPCLVTACLEARDLKNKDIYKITLKSDIEINDLDSICLTENVSKPYMPKEWTDFFDSLYGYHLKGLRFESAQNSYEYSIVIYHDWFKEFPSIVDKQLMDKDAVLEYLIEFVRLLLARGSYLLTPVQFGP